MAKHELKIYHEFFERKLQYPNEKPWELRYNDRNFQVKDDILYREWTWDNNGTYTGREMTAEIIYILEDHDGLSPQYVIFTDNPLMYRNYEDGKWRSVK